MRRTLQAEGQQGRAGRSTDVLSAPQIHSSQGRHVLCPADWGPVICPSAHRGWGIAECCGHPPAWCFLMSASPGGGGCL